MKEREFTVRSLTARRRRMTRLVLTPLTSTSRPRLRRRLRGGSSSDADSAAATTRLAASAAAASKQLSGHSHSPLGGATRRVTHAHGARSRSDVHADVAGAAGAADAVRRVLLLRVLQLCVSIQGAS